MAGQTTGSQTSSAVAEGADDAKATARRAWAWLPASLRTLIDQASRHHTVTLAAGLAFFGLISIGPAVGVGFGVVRLAAPDALVDRLVDLLKNGFPETLGLSELLEQMEDRAVRYLGIGMLVLLWPATTLASGWTRALDAINEFESTGGVRGLWGRLRGLAPGGILLTGLFLLVAMAALGSAAVSDDAVLLLPGVAALLVLEFASCLAIYRWLPSEARPIGELWRGALWAAGGVLLATVGFAVALTLGEGVAEQFPPSLVTAIVLGMWLYGANLALLLGDEYNAARRSIRRDGETPDGPR